MTDKVKNPFKIGDIVKYKSSFLKSVGWYTDVPKNGKVVEVSKELNFPKVLFCNRDDAILVNPNNLMLASRPDTT